MHYQVPDTEADELIPSSMIFGIIFLTIFIFVIWPSIVKIISICILLGTLVLAIAICYYAGIYIKKLFTFIKEINHVNY